MAPELKYDGCRIGCRTEDGRVRLLSRKGNDWTTHFPQIAEAAGALRVKSALIDGEVCAVLPDGRTSFQALQNMASSHAKIVYYVFDLLYLDGRSFIAEPLEVRKRALKKITRGARIHFADQTDEGNLRHPSFQGLREDKAATEVRREA